MSGRWYKRCGADFIAGTMKLNLEEKGAYSLCLDLIYDRGGPIPDDDRWLSGICGVSIRKWRSLRGSLIRHGKIAIDGDTITNSRAAFELVSTELQRRNQAEAGAKGGRKRAENASDCNENNDVAQATLKPIEENREEKKEERAHGPCATRLASDFIMPSDWLEWAARDRDWQPADLRDEAASFVDFWHAKSGRDAAKLDWLATWRNWCRNSNRAQSRDRPRIGRNGLGEGIPC